MLLSENPEAFKDAGDFEDTSPIHAWTFTEADLALCADQTAEDNKEFALSQAWQCWRTADGAKAAAEAWARSQYEDEGVADECPAPDWREQGSGALRWDVDEDLSIEVHPLRVQD